MCYICLELQFIDIFTVLRINFDRKLMDCGEIIPTENGTMTERELRKLGRTELLELLLDQSREVERLQKELDAAKAQLASREISIQQAGSIAEAALQLNGVFQAAQEACAQYTENIQRLSARQEEACARMEQETRERCQQQERETEERCAKREQESRAACDQMAADARTQSEAYWNDVSRKMQEYAASYEGLKVMLQQAPQFQRQE